MENVKISVLLSQEQLIDLIHAVYEASEHVDNQLGYLEQKYKDTLYTCSPDYKDGCKKYYEGHIAYLSKKFECYDDLYLYLLDYKI